MVPMNVTRYGDSFEKRIDPWGRDYYWLTGGPPAATPGHETDLSALAKGKVTHYAAGLQHDPPGRPGRDGAVAVSDCRRSLRKTRSKRPALEPSRAQRVEPTRPTKRRKAMRIDRSKC